MSETQDIIFERQNYQSFNDSQPQNNFQILEPSQVF
jgi:hypothetical protein